MHAKIEPKGNMMVCRLDGEVDVNSSPDLKKVFDKLIAKKTAKIVIDFSRVTYVDSSGLATLVEIFKNMKSYGGRMRLSGLASKIKSIFEITKLDKLFEIIADTEEAISAWE